MEPSYQTRKMIGRLLVVITLAIMMVSFLAHYTSPLIGPLTKRAQTPLYLALLTKPAMLIAYTPATRKAHITLSSKTCTPDNLSTCFKQPADTFFIPQEQDQHTYWAQFGQDLEQWRFSPKIVWNFIRAYVNALVQKRTNLRPSEFLLLSKELIELTRTDFAIEYPAQPAKKKKSARTEPEPQIQQKPEIILPNSALQQAPLVVEVLNASGQKGLALRVTQYLREQNAKGLLRIDVLQYDNYPTVQDTSFIIDYSGKQVQVSQTGQALGIRGEIRSEKSTTAICDTRIILGKDFKMPL